VGGINELQKGVKERKSEDTAREMQRERERERERE
jgi:hypothetical protein